MEGKQLRTVTLGGENAWTCDLPTVEAVRGWIDPYPSTRCLQASAGRPGTQHRKQPRLLSPFAASLFATFVMVALLTPVSLALLTLAGVELPPLGSLLTPRWLLDLIGYHGPGLDA